MSARPCSMAALVEASRDGRLGQNEAGSVERHLAGCSACTTLAQDLDRLGLLARAPLGRISELDRRRARVRLLQRAAIPAPRSSRRSLAIAASLVALSLAAVAKVAVGWPRGALSRADAPILVASSASRFRLLATKATAAGAEIAPALPPAEGARSAEAGRAGGVEGSFDLASVAVPLPLATASSSVVVISSDSAGTASRRAVHPAHAAPAAPPNGPSQSTASAFDEAVSLVERGDYGAATERLEAFQRAHAKDPRAEDAAFLAVVALDHAGRRAEAVRAARAYLAAFPGGFRRAEAEAIASEPASDRPHSR